MLKSIVSYTETPVYIEHAFFENLSAYSDKPESSAQEEAPPQQPQKTPQPKLFAMMLQPKVLQKPADPVSRSTNMRACVVSLVQG